MSDEKWDLSRLSTGERCALRRAAGSPEPNVAAWWAFYTACGECSDENRPYWYAAMCMECMWRETDEPQVLPMEQCLRRYLLMEEQATKSIKKRMLSLLETNWSDDGFLLGKLKAMASILKTKTNCRPDFKMLADDLQQWNDQKRDVQRKWLRALSITEADQAKNEGGTVHDA